MELQENQTNGKKYLKSTIAAETLALLEGSENCFLLGSIIKEMLDVDGSSSVFQIRALTDDHV